MYGERFTQGAMTILAPNVKKHKKKLMAHRKPKCGSITTGVQLMNMTSDASFLRTRYAKTTILPQILIEMS